MGLFKKRKKYYAVFLVNQTGSFSRVAKRRFRPTNQKVRYRKKTYIVDVSTPSYTKGLKIFYFYEIEKPEHMTFLKKDSVLSPKIIDMILSQKIVNELTTNLSGNALRMNLITLIFGALMGGAFGFIIAGFV